MARKVSVDIDKIRHASVAPFEEDEGLYGINWELTDRNWSGSSLVGTKAEAEAELRRIHMHQRSPRSSNG